MSNIEKYTKEQWRTISSVPQACGAIMASAGYSGLIGSGKELFASVRGVMAAKEAYADNVLIQGILPDAKDRKKAMKDAKEQRTFLMDRIKEKNIKNSEELRELILQDCKEAITLLNEKETPETVAQYKEWVLKVAEGVANAAKEGGFLGFGGERFSEKEQKLFAELKTVMQ